MKRFNLLLAFTFIFLYSCQKEQDIAEICNPLETSFSIDYASELIFCSFPSFNPQNSEEVAFLYQDYSYKSGYRILQLVKCNWKTQKITVIKDFDHDDTYQFDAVSWSSNGWIAGMADGAIYVVRPDGSEFQQLTIAAHDLEFGNNNLLYYTSQGSPSQGIEANYLFSLDLDRSSIDTVAYYESDKALKSIFSIAKEARFSSQFIFDAPLTTSQKTNLAPYVDTYWTGTYLSDDGDIEYTSGGSSIYITNGLMGPADGLKRMDIASRNVTYLKAPCESIKYGKMDASSDGKFLSVEKYFLYNAKDGSIAFKKSIIVIDLETMSEKSIQF